MSAIKPYRSFLRALALAGGVFSCATSWAGTAFQSRCEALGRTTVTVTSEPAGYDIDTSVSSHRLSAITEHPVAGHMVLGLTQSQSRVEMGFAGTVLQDPGTGYECFAPRIRVVLRYLPMKVYVGSEFPPGSCAYQQILAHELRHVQTYLRYLPRAELQVRDALTKRFAALPMYSPSGTGKAALQTEINNAWLPYIKSELARVEQLQAKIDSPQEYARLSHTCNGEVQAIFHPRG